MNTPQLEGISVLVDGGCRNNNKPVNERKMYGSFTVFHNGKRMESEYQDIKLITHHIEFPHDEGDHASNQLAELYALGEALGYVSALQLRMQKKERKLDIVTVMSDSEFALGLASKAMKLNIKSHPDMVDAVQGVQDLAAITNVIFQHVDNLWVKSVLGH
jgi:ribonuclease HI